MKNLTLMQKVFGHLKTVHHHRKLVRKYCFECGLYYQGLTHDLSKYSPSELFESIKYYQGYRSPYSYEKELYGYALGWLHHKGRNKHHFEYWIDIKDGKFTPIEMPYKYVLESVCDRIAACITYEKDNYTKESALKYFTTRSDSFLMHENTSKLMLEILTRICIVGEKQALQEYKKRPKH